jgi:PAS domain S-box-containing protein
MSHPEGSSLLDFVDAPVIVGDPDSRVIYVNRCFERRLGIAPATARGESLSSLFEGGSREAVLKAVAEVCTNGQTSHFRLREAGHDYLAQASPIEAEGDRVGVVILLTDEPESRASEKFPSQLAEPLDLAIGGLQEVATAASDPRTRESVEAGLGALEQIRKLVSGPRPGSAAGGEDAVVESRFDPVRVVRQAGERLGPELADAGWELDLLVPHQLPAVRGAAEQLESALIELIRARIGQSSESGHLTLSARVVGGRGRHTLLVSVVHADSPPEQESQLTPEAPAREIRERIEELGGSLFASASPLGRVTSLQLQLAD